MKITTHIACALIMGSAASTSAGDTRATIESDWQQQEKTTYSRKWDSKEAVLDLLRRGQLQIKDMKHLGVAVDKAQTTLQSVAIRLRQNKPDYAALYTEARWTMRNLAFSNPLLDFDQILFVKRNTPTMQHQCGHRVGEAQIPGANLCIIKGLQPDGQVKELLVGDYTQGGIGRPDLSFDGKKMVFPFARKREKGTGFRPNTYGGTGLCEKYDIYEIRIDGTQLKPVVASASSEDTEPCYLSGGRIAFTSSRNQRFVQCGDWALVNGIFSVKHDGSDLYKITEPQDGEFYPSVLEDGRILYTRWDYVMKPYNTQQQFWAVNPDGRRAELAYGDYYAFSTGPIALFEGRQIPGTSKLIATGAAHHNNCAGPIMIVDMDQNRGGPNGMKRITPEIHYPEIKRKGGGSNTQSPTGWYRSPYPLGENHFLTTYSYGPHTISNYGIYLMDIHGNRELIYRTNSKFSCYAPIPIRARKEPPVLPNMVQKTDPNNSATIMVNDIYQGLLQEGVKPGEVKHLRIIEVMPKTQHTIPRRVDVGVNSGWDTRKVLGTVPVENDGSAHFTLPPHKLILFEALDKDYLEIKRMRNYLNVKPGETVSCIGCHEPYGISPVPRNKAPIASLRPPSATIPPPWGVRGMSYKHVVQPVLDQHCASCHDGSAAKDHSFNLKGNKLVQAPKGYDKDEGPQHAVSESFLNLLKYVNYIKVGGYGNHDPKTLIPSKANSIGSKASRLTHILNSGHHNVSLNQDEWRALTAWIDCNAPYYGDHQDIITIQDLPALKAPQKQRTFAIADLRRHEGLIMRNEKIVWSYPVKSATDMKVFPDGSYLISGQNDVVLVDYAKQIRFAYQGSQLFSADRRTNGNILINSNPSRTLIEYNLSDQETEKTSTAIKGSNKDIKTHYHALHIDQLDNGDCWVAHRHHNIARKYNRQGNVLCTIKMPCSVTSVQELPNGNVLVAGGKPARLSEFDPQGQEIWTLIAKDVPEANLMTICGFHRLRNGNTLLTNWTGHGYQGKYLPIIEVTPEKKIVWSFSDTKLIPEPISIQEL